jgi:hypothetical protein
MEMNSISLKVEGGLVQNLTDSCPQSYVLATVEVPDVTQDNLQRNSLNIVFLVDNGTSLFIKYHTFIFFIFSNAQ